VPIVDTPLLVSVELATMAKKVFDKSCLEGKVAFITGGAYACLNEYLFHLAQKRDLQGNRGAFC